MAGLKKRICDKAHLCSRKFAEQCPKINSFSFPQFGRKMRCNRLLVKLLVIGEEIKVKRFSMSHLESKRSSTRKVPWSIGKPRVRGTLFERIASRTRQCTRMPRQIV